MRQSIEDLMRLIKDGEITAYRVFKETGISQQQISNLRKGETDIGNLTIATGEKLEAFYKFYLEEIQ